jgi:uncharacterized protein (DUF302 family)
MKALSLAVAMALTAFQTAADVVKIEAQGAVPEVMDRLESAVQGAGATVFARVDHAAGAASVDMELAPAQVLIFGNPALGTPAMQADALAGLFLPLKVLAYEDTDGKVWLAYQDPKETFDDLKIDDDAEYIGKMKGALEKLTGAAAGG